MVRFCFCKSCVLRFSKSSQFLCDMRLLTSRFCFSPSDDRNLTKLTAMVQQAMQYIDEAPNVETRIELVETLNTVSAGKIYVEIARARLIKKLAKIREEQGRIAEAADCMQEVAVETFGAMAKSEKIAFILEQVRLCLDRKDFVRAQILARKINPKSFTETLRQKEAKEAESIIEEPAPDVPALSELRRIYYEHMIRYYAHDHEYLEGCVGAIRLDMRLW